MSQKNKTPSRKDTEEVESLKRLRTPPKRFLFSQGHITEDNEQLTSSKNPHSKNTKLEANDTVKKPYEMLDLFAKEPDNFKDDI